MEATGTEPASTLRARERTSNLARYWLLAIVGALALVLFFALREVLPIASWLLAFQRWMAGAGWHGWAVFILVYIAWTVGMLPGSPLTLMAGFAFGFWKGFVAVSLGSTAGATLAFLLGRHVFRERVERLGRTSPMFLALDRALGEEGGKVVALVRLSPLFPFNLTNYLLSVTSVRLGPYLLATWLGMIPGTLLFTYAGFAGRGLAAEGAPPGAGWLRLAGLAATLVLTWVMARKARLALKRRVLPP